MAELDGISAGIVQAIATHILLVHHQRGVEPIPQRGFVFAVVQGKNHLFVAFLVVGKHVIVVVEQCNIGIVFHILIGLQRRLVVACAASHLLSAPQINLAFEHFGGCERPIHAPVGKGIVVVVGVFRGLDVGFYLRHHVGCRILFAGYFVQINGVAFGVLQVKNDIAIATQQLEIEKCAQTMAAGEVFVFLFVAQKRCLVNLINHQVDLIDARIKAAILADYRTTLFKCVVP